MTEQESRDFSQRLFNLAVAITRSQAERPPSCGGGKAMRDATDNDVTTISYAADCLETRIRELEAMVRELQGRIADLERQLKEAKP